MSYFRVVSAGSFSLKKVQAACSSGGCCVVSSARSLHVSVEHQTSIYSFEDEVEAVVCWREEKGSYFVGVAERSGSVNVLSLSLKTVLHSYKIIDRLSSTREFKSLRPVSLTPDKLSLAVLLSNALHIIYFRADEDGVDHSEMVTVDLSSIHDFTQTCTEICIFNTTYLITGGSGQNPLALWKLDEELPCLTSQVSSTLLGSGAVTQAEVTADNKYMLIMTDQGEIQVWLPEMMTLLRVWGGKKCQILVQKLSLLSQFDKHRVCIMCNSADLSQRELRVLTVPGLETIFSRSFSVSVRLVSCFLQVEAILLLVEELPDSNDFRLERLECGSPQDRVTELVVKGKYEEAEMLVKEYDLDPQILLEKKLIKVNELVSDGNEGSLPALLQCLKDTKNIDNAVSLILATTYPSLDTTYTVISSLCYKVINSGHSAAETVTFSLKRFTTYSIMELNGSGQSWPSFLSASCLQLITGWLCSDNFSNALLFWMRHKNEIERELNSVDTSSLLQYIPCHLPSLSKWLTATILPYLSTHRPHQIKPFLFQLSSFLCNTDQNITDDWSANVLTLIDQLLLSLAKLESNYRAPLDVSPLTQLQQRLVKWVSMSPVIRQNLTFLNYEKLSPTQLVYWTLDRAIDVEQLSNLLTGPLSEFVEQRQLDLDALLTDYLKILLTRAPTDSQDFKDSLWESIVVTIVNNISSCEMKVTCCLKILNSVDSPWGIGVTGLVNNCLQTKAPNVQELRDLHDLLRMQMILAAKYEIINFNYSDSSTGDVYIRKILAREKSDGLSDALWVALKYGIPQSRVYVRHLFQLCCQQEVEEAGDIIKSLHPNTLSSVCDAAISFSLTHINLSLLPYMLESYCGAIQLALLTIPYTPRGTEPLTQTYLKHLFQLATEYSVFLTPSQLSSRSYTTQLLHDFLSNISPVSSLPLRAIKLGHLLGYSEPEVCCALIKIWLQEHSDPLPLHLLGKCPTIVSLPLLHSVLTGPISFSLPLVQEFTDLAACITSLCPPGQLKMALSSFRGCCLLLCILVTKHSSEKESYAWPWTTRVTEQGLPLKKTTTFLKIPSIVLLPQCPAHHTIQSDVVDVLQTNGHLELSLHTACQLALEPMTSTLSALLEKVLSMSKVDHSYGLTLLLALPPKTSLHLLRSKQTVILSSYSCVIAMCRLTIDYCILYGLPQAVKDTASVLMTGAVWAKLLRNHKVSFSSAFKGGEEEKTRVLSDIVSLRTVSHQLILAYCRTYGLGGPGALLTRLRLILGQWETDYQHEFRVTCTHIENSPFIPSLLQTFITTKVCPYDYSRIKFVLRELRQRCVTHVKLELLLSSLESYGDRQPPSNEEKLWHSSVCHGVCFQMYSSTRIPLNIFFDNTLGLKLIAYEACSVSSVNKLLSIAQLLKFPEEELYSTVLKSLGKYDINYSQLANLLSNVSEISLRLSLTIKLADNMSTGKERTAALQDAMELAKENDGVLNDLKSRLNLAKTNYLLEDIGLTSLCGSPSSIICTVYLEVPISSDPPAAACVHNITQKIAEIHSINLLALSSDLLQEWLLPSTKNSQDLNTTLVREIEETVHTVHTCSLENWKRMVYLLTDSPHISHLTTVLYNCSKSESQVVRPCTRLLALDLMLTAVPSAVVLEVARVDTTSALRDLVQQALFITELGSIQITLTSDSFRTQNKASLVSSLIHTRSDSPKALQLAVDLASYYKLMDPDIWDSLLSSLLRMKMETNLQNLLPKVVELKHHQSVETLGYVWRSVIESNYEKGLGSQCLSALHLLYQCPVLYQIDLPAIINTITSAGAYSHAISASLLLPPSIRSSTIEVILSSVPPDQLLQLLETFVTSPTPELFPEVLLNIVYDYIDKKGYHKYLLGTSHFAPMVTYLIDNHQISSLLKTIRSQERETEAIQLVNLYFKTHNILSVSTGSDILL